MKNMPRATIKYPTSDGKFYNTKTEAIEAQRKINLFGDLNQLRKKVKIETFALDLINDVDLALEFRNVTNAIIEYHRRTRQRIAKENNAG